MRPSPASCDYATPQRCRISARCARSGLPGRFATDVVANHAVPGRAKSNARLATLRPKGKNRLYGIPAQDRAVKQGQIQRDA